MFLPRLLAGLCFCDGIRIGNPNMAEVCITNAAELQKCKRGV